MSNLKIYKAINNRKFDLGTLNSSSSGREALDLSSNMGFSAKNGYTGSSQDANGIRSSYKPGITAYNMQTLTSAASPYVGQGLLSLGSVLSKSAAGAAGAAGTAGAAATTGSKIMNGLGNAATIAGVTAGAYNMIGGIGDVNSAIDSFRNNHLTADQIDSTMGSTTQTKYGVSYESKTGPDSAGLMDYMNALNDADSAQLKAASSRVGTGVGGILGSIGGGIATGAIGGPAGAAIGAGIGLLSAFTGGWIGGLFGKSKALKEAEKRQAVAQSRINDVSDTVVGVNTQSESEAGSQGLRSQFNGAHAETADKGKIPGQRFDYGSVAGIHTPQGYTYGKVQGLASHDEGMIDMSTGETKYLGSADPTAKEPRKDNVPVGGQGFDDNVAIPGHLKDVDGVMFSDKARPYFKANELIKIINQQIDVKDEENNNNDKRDKATKKFVSKKLDSYRQQSQQQYQQNAQAIADIVDRQTAVQEDMKRLSLLKQYLNRQRTYDLGKWLSKIGNALGSSSRHGLASPLLSLANGMIYSSKAQAAADSQQPYAANSYVENATAPAALKIMGGLGYDPSAQLALMNRTAAQNRYAINQAGNLSAGQRLALSTAANNDLFSRRGEILADAYNKNAAYKQAYAQQLMLSGESAASRQQQALATQQQMYAQAVGAKQKLQEQARKNWYTTTQQALKDWNSAAMFNRTADLYDAQGGNADAQGGNALKRPPQLGLGVSVIPTALDLGEIKPLVINNDYGKRARRFDDGFTPFSESVMPDNADAFRTNWINQMALNSVNKNDFNDDDEYYNAVENAGRNFGQYYDLNKNKIHGEYNDWAENRSKQAAAEDAINKKLATTPLPSVTTAPDHDPDAIVNDAITRINDSAKKLAPQVRRRRPIKKPVNGSGAKLNSAQDTQRKTKQDHASSILPDVVVVGKRSPKAKSVNASGNTKSTKRPTASTGGRKASAANVNLGKHRNYSANGISQQAAYNRRVQGEQLRRLQERGPLEQKYLYSHSDNMRYFNALRSVGFRHDNIVENLNAKLKR